MILDKKDPAACEERSVLVLMEPVRHRFHVLLELVKDLAEARPDRVDGGVLRQYRNMLLQLVQKLVLHVAIEDTSLLQLDEELLLGRQWCEIRPVQDTVVVRRFLFGRVTDHGLQRSLSLSRLFKGLR